MMTTSTRIEEYLATALAGSMTGQIASERGLTFTELLGPDLDGKSEQLQQITKELSELGLEPLLLASHALRSLVALFAQEENAELVIAQFTALLWSILGDPKNGGSPPEIYRRAGAAMHLALLGILDPSIVENRSRK